MVLAVTGLGFLFTGLTLALLMGALFRVRRGEVATHERMVTTPTTPIAQIRGDGVYEIVGRARPSEQGTLRSPLSGAEAFLCHIEISEWRGRHAHVLWREAARKSFVIDDGSGAQAYVLPEGAAMIARGRRYGGFGGVHAVVVVGELQSERAALAPEGASYVMARTGRTPDTVIIEEKAIGPGEIVYALGPASRGPRDARGASPIVFRHHDDAAGKLVVSNVPETELTAVLGVRRKARRIIFIVGLVLSAMGAIAIAVGLVSQFAR